MTNSINYGWIAEYNTGADLRRATADELRASLIAARTDGGAGVIEVDGLACYVAGESAEARAEVMA